MYSTLSGLMIGFHGCDCAVADRIISGGTRLNPSHNNYDWLGHGIYFWENNPDRAMQYAKSLYDIEHAHPRIENPAILGAVIDLGHCLNLVDSNALAVLRETYLVLKDTFERNGTPLPVNKKPLGEENDLLLRHLDCAVIEMLHEFNKKMGRREFDSVRGVFWEGNDLYPNAGFKEKNHIQICIRNPNCIKGYFRPLEKLEDFPLP